MSVLYPAVVVANEEMIHMTGENAISHYPGYHHDILIHLNGIILLLEVGIKDEVSVIGYHRTCLYLGHS